MRENSNQNLTLSFVIGAVATGKTTFITEHFSKKDTVILNIYDYQQKLYKESGFDKYIPINMEIELLHKANEKLLDQIITHLKEGQNVVVEHTLFKAKRRVSYIDKIRNHIKNLHINIYVMCPDDTIWQTYINNRKLDKAFQYYKSMSDNIQFPNISEGFDKIYQVINNNITLKIDEPNLDILTTARKELIDEAEKIKNQENRKIKRKKLTEYINPRPF